MQRYNNNAQDSQGNALVTATVTVYAQGTTNKATIYSDNGITPTGTLGVTTTDSLGEFFFYAANGRYDIAISKTGIVTQTLSDIILFDNAASTGAGSVGFTQSGTGLIRPTSTNVSTALADVQTYGVEKYLAKLRRIAKTAMARNPVLLPELLGSIAWAASTAYTAAQQRSNGGKVYECTVSGTSASSGGPAGYGTGIIDNGAVWSFVGMQTAPVLSVSAAVPGGLTNSYTYITHDGKIKYLGGPPYDVGTEYKFPATNMGSSVGNIGVVAGGTDSYSNFKWGVEIMTDATKISIETDQHASITWDVLVDGQYVSKTPTALNTATRSFNTLDFTNVQGGARKVRRITFESEGTVGFYSIRVAPTEKIWKAQDTDTVRAIVIGDSFVAGGLASYTRTGFVDTVAKLLGWRDPWHSGVASTGYLNNGTTKKTYRERITTDVTSRSPDVVVITGGINDLGTNIQSEATTYFAALRTALPIVPILVIGNFEPGTARASAITLQAQLSAAVTAQNDARIVFFPTIAPTDGEWVTGTGRVGATVGDGNADIYTASDGTHPTQSGHDYLGDRVASAIRSWLEAPY